MHWFREENSVATPCPLMKPYETCVAYEKPARGLMKNSSCQRSFVLKVVPKTMENDIVNYQKGYLAIYS